MTFLNPIFWITSEKRHCNAQKKYIIRTERIRYLLQEIKESLDLILDNLPVTGNLDDFIELGLLKDGIYKRLEYVLQSIFDICAIINRDLKLGIPQNDDDIIKNLVKGEIIDDHMGEMLRNMKGMRNILVHQHGRINDEIIFEVLMKQLEDLDSIGNHIQVFINSQVG